MDIDIDYKKDILFIRIIGNFIRSNIFYFEEKVIPIILELTAKKVSINLFDVCLIDKFGINSFIKLSNIVNRFNGKVVLYNINDSIYDYINTSDVFDYCFKSKNEKYLKGVFSI